MSRIARGALPTFILATFALVIAFAVTVMADPRLLTLMPLLVPLCLLAVIEIDTLPRGFSGALDWFGILTFGLVTIPRRATVRRCTGSRSVCRSS